MLEGIIYKTQSYLENDRLLFVYTRQGKITLIAKGAQKLKSNARTLAQYLTQISFQETPRKSMYSLREAKTLNHFEYIKQEYFKIQQAASMLDLINQLVMPHDAHDKIYRHLLDALNYFSVQSVLSFFVKMLQLLGYHLSLNPDGRIIKGYSVRASRLIYEEEHEAIDLNVRQTKELLKLTLLSYDRIDEVNQDDLAIIKQMIKDYYQYHLQTTLKI